MSERTVISAIARSFDAWTRCRRMAEDTGRSASMRVIDADGIDRTVDHWIGMADSHAYAMAQIVREYLPSGSGVNNGTRIDLETSRADRLVFVADFHHMDQSGGYDGWTDHTIIVRPSLAFGIDLRVTGRDRDGIKDYLADLFHSALTQTIRADDRQTTIAS